MNRRRLDLTFIVRLCLSMVLIYFAVWRESKIALSIVLVATLLAIEVLTFMTNEIWRQRR